MIPLAERMRANSLKDFIGQENIVGEGKPLYNLIKSKKISNCILYGPPGTGKTTLANIMADYVDKKFYKLNATTASTKDIHEITSNTDTLLGYKGVVIYIDEIQHFSKKQQQSLLEFMENGKVTLIASTTENPYFAIHKAIISRCNIFKFEPLTSKDIFKGLLKTIDKINSDYKISYEDEAIRYISEICSGDYRKALNILEFAIHAREDEEVKLTTEYIENLSQSHINSDSSGDEYYNCLSAFQKSIRGSDPDAAIHYLARLIKGGNLTAIVRRLSVIVAEDIGLAHPNALTVVNSGIELVLKIGLPEARIILAELTIFLATLPKSNSAYLAINQAMSDLDNVNYGEIPHHLRDGHYGGAEKLGVQGYKYPHNFEGHYVKQQYMPKGLEDRNYYLNQSNKYEDSIKKYWDNIKNNQG